MTCPRAKIPDFRKKHKKSWGEKVTKSRRNPPKVGVFEKHENAKSLKYTDSWPNEAKMQKHENAKSLKYTDSWPK